MIAENTTPEPETPGGLGGSVYPFGIRDARLADRAIRQRWPVPEEKRAPLIDGLIEMALDTMNDPKHRIAATRSVFTAEAQNMEDEKRANPVARQVEVTHVVITPVERASALEARMLAEAAERGLVIDGLVVGDGSRSGDCVPAGRNLAPPTN